MSNAEVLEKSCKGCGEKKPLTEFYSEPRVRDGRMARCAACMRAQSGPQKRLYRDPLTGRVAPWTPAGDTRLRDGALQVVRALLAGHTSYADIGDYMCLSKRTVQTHLGEIYAKCGAHCVADVVLMALGHKPCNIDLFGQLEREEQDPKMRTLPKPAPKDPRPPKSAPVDPARPRITRDAAKLRMAYTMCDYLGIGVSAHSGAVYEALNQAGFYWYGWRMAWGKLGKEEAGADVAESDGGE